MRPTQVLSETGEKAFLYRQLGLAVGLLVELVSARSTCVPQVQVEPWNRVLPPQQLSVYLSFLSSGSGVGTSVDTF